MEKQGFTISVDPCREHDDEYFVTLFCTQWESGHCTGASMVAQTTIDSPDRKVTSDDFGRWLSAMVIHVSSAVLQLCEGDEISPDMGVAIRTLPQKEEEESFE